MQVFRVTEMVPGPLVAQIGRISVQWSILELQVEQAIWQLDGLTRKEGRLITAKENLDPRLKRLLKLANEKLRDQQLGEIKTIIKDIKVIAKRRNWAIHGLYGMDQTGKFHSITYRDDPKGIAYKADQPSLRAVRVSISEVRRRLEAAIPAR